MPDIQPLLNNLFPAMGPAMGSNAINPSLSGSEPHPTNPDEIDPQELIDQKWLQFTDELTKEKVLREMRKFSSDWEAEESQYLKHLKDNQGNYINQNTVIEGTSIKVPLTWTIVETEMPWLVNAIYGQTDLLDLKPKFADPTNAQTFKVKTFLNNNIRNVCDGEDKTGRIARTALVYGTAVAKVWWNDDICQDVDNQTGSLIYVNSEHPDFDLVDPFSFAFDRSNKTSDLKNCKWVRERIFKEKEEMFIMRDNGLCGWFEEADLTSALNKRDKFNNKNPASQDDEKTYYDEYSATLYDKDPITEKYVKHEYIVWVLAENKVIKFLPTPLDRKMYTIVRCYDIPGQFLGKGEPDTIGALTEHASYIWYQLGKTVKRVGQQMALVGMNSGLSPEQMRTIEDGIFPVNDITQITFQPSMDSQDVEVLTTAFEGITKASQDVTGIGPAMQGTSIGNMSATEAAQVFQAASSRLEMKLKNLKKGLIKNVAEMMFMLCKQSLTEGTTFFTSDDKPVFMQPQDFAGNYEFSPAGSISQVNKALMLAMGAQVAQTIVQACEVSKQTSTPIEPIMPAMLQGLAAPYTDGPDISKYWKPIVPPPPPPPPQFPESIQQLTGVVRPNPVFPSQASKPMTMDNAFANGGGSNSANNKIMNPQTQGQQSGQVLGGR